MPTEDHDAGFRFACRPLAAGCQRGRVRQIMEPCRGFFFSLPECRQRCRLLQRRSLTGISQLLLAVRLQAGAGRCGAATVLSCNATCQRSGHLCFMSAEREREEQTQTLLFYGFLQSHLNFQQQQQKKKKSSVFVH